MNGTGKTGSSSQRPLGQAPERPFAWPGIAKLDELRGHRQQLLLCRLGAQREDVQAVACSAAAEPRHRLHELIVRVVGECARQSRRIGGEAPELPIESDLAQA